MLKERKKKKRGKVISHDFPACSSQFSEQGLEMLVNVLAVTKASVLGAIKPSIHLKTNLMAYG